ncbi:MAG TPA: hypothetical protein VIY71_02685 [Solirubrobacterales bacterium]
MIAAGAIVSQFATASGFIAATIAVSGFLAHAGPAIVGKDESELRRATAVGGLCGFVSTAVIIAISMVFSL